MKIIIKLFAAGILSLLIWQFILMNTMVNSTGYVHHPVLGRIYKPGTYMHGTEGYSRTNINSSGMRGEEIQNKTDSEYRILVLGDSFTEAFQVSDAHIYPNLLEKMITRKDGRLVQTINAGRSGACPAFYIHLAKFYNSTYKQDFTIIQINDHDFTQEMLNQTRNFYIIHEGNEYRTVMNDNFNSANSLMQKIPQARDLLEISVVRVGAEKLQSLFSGDTETDAAVNANRSNDDYNLLIEWTLKQLKQRYPNLLLVYLPTLDYGDVSQKPSGIEEGINRYAGWNDVPLLNMREDFVTYYEKNKQPVHGFNNTVPGTGHINEIGHLLIANKIEQYFLKGAQ